MVFCYGSLILSGLLISFRFSPNVSLVAIIIIRLIRNIPLLFFNRFFLFLVWVLVYIGGIIIVFTYVVFFSNYNLEYFSISLSYLLIPIFLLSIKKLSFQSRLGEKLILSNNSPEDFFQFIFLGGISGVLLIYVFITVSFILVLLLIILKSTTYQQLKGLG